MLAWLAVGLCLPLLAKLTANDLALQTLGTSTLAADLSGGYIVTAPVRLAQLPRISLERGALHAVDAKGRLVVSDGMTDAPGSGGKAQPGGTIVISNGEIRIGAAGGGLDASIESAAGAFIHPLLGQLAGQAITTVALRRVTLVIALPDGESEALRDVTGELKRWRNGWQFKGDGLLMGQKTKLDVASGSPDVAKTAERRNSAVAAQSSLKFSIRNALLDWTFDGRIGLSKAFHLVGTTDVDLTVARQLPLLSRLLPDSLSALGAPVARNLKAKGALDWSAAGMVLSGEKPDIGAKFDIDGNEATGALSLDRRLGRPLLTGTLAFQSLDLTRQLSASLTAGALKSAAQGMSVQSAGHLTALAAMLMQSWGPSGAQMPLVALMDADLRVSSDRLVLGPVTWRRTAATVSNRGGKLLADVAAFEFDGGRGAGQLSGDFTGAAMTVGLRGRLDNLDASRATSALFGTSFIEGRGIVTLDLTGSGASLNDVVRSANGRITTVIPDGGRMSVDLRGLAAASEKRAIEGWSAGGRDQMAFDGLDASFALANGVLKADEKSQARIRDDVIKLSGTIDMPSSRLNITAVGPFIGFSGQTPNVLQINGPWARPTVRLESATRKAAAAIPTSVSPQP
jgi:uncharacterized protein involved in outer membrane biogenesis